MSYHHPSQVVAEGDGGDSLETAAEAGPDVLSAAEDDQMFLNWCAEDSRCSRQVDKDYDDTGDVLSAAKRAEYLFRSRRGGGSYLFRSRRGGGSYLFRSKKAPGGYLFRSRRGPSYLFRSKKGGGSYLFRSRRDSTNEDQVSVKHSQLVLYCMVVSYCLLKQVAAETELQLNNEAAASPVNRPQKLSLIGERPNRGGYLFRTRRYDTSMQPISSETDLDEEATHIPISREVR